MTSSLSTSFIPSQSCVQSPPSSPPSSAPSSVVSLPNPTSKALPFISENINSDKQSSETSPESSTSVPLPAGTTEPVNENASTVDPLAETVKPFAVASPPDAPVTHPSWSN